MDLYFWVVSRDVTHLDGNKNTFRYGLTMVWGIQGTHWYRVALDEPDLRYIALFRVCPNCVPMNIKDACDLGELAECGL